MSYIKSVKLRELTLDEKYMVGRVIARPFVGEPETLHVHQIVMTMH